MVPTGIFTLSTIILFGLTNAVLIPTGTKQIYKYDNSIELQNLQTTNGEMVVTQLNGQLSLSSIWNTTEKHLIKFEITFHNCTVQIFNSKENAPFSCDIKPFYVLFEKNIPPKIHSDEQNEFLLNLQKGLSSLFYFNYQPELTTEKSVFGKCKASYEKLLNDRIKKYLTNCTGWLNKSYHRSQKVLDLMVNSIHEVEYGFSKSGELNSILAVERHKVKVAMTQNLGMSINAITKIRHYGTQNVDIPKPVIDHIEKILESSYGNILGEVDVNRNPPESQLAEIIKTYHKELADESPIGQDYSDIFVKLLSVARHSTRIELQEILKMNENKPLILQIANLYGAVQSKSAYDAVIASFDWNQKTDLPALEKFLQSLSTGIRPNKYIIENLLGLLRKNSIQDNNLRETTMLCICSMSQRLYTSEGNVGLYDEIKHYIVQNMKICATNECKAMFIRCLRNLGDTTTIPLLLQIAMQEAKIASIAAMKALKAFKYNDFTDAQRLMLKNVFYQNTHKIDSSLKTLALDLLLHPGVSESELVELIEILIKDNETHEVKTYFIQKYRLLQQTFPRFKTLTKSIPSISRVFNNYNILSQNGLSTVIERPYISTNFLNGTIQSKQEVNNGILKRGSVSITLWGDDEGATIFELGLYTSGVSSLVGGNNDQDDSTDEEPVTAGMEITVLGSQMRPLTLFNGHGELMGHIWSGTASEPISAFQSTILVHDSEQFIVLHNGMVLNLQLLGANSVDLFGQAQFSIWNRNAHTQITKSSGWTIQKTLFITIFNVTLKHSISAMAQPNLDLIGDIDFYSDMKFCLQLKRAKTSIKVQSTNLIFSGSNIYKTSTSNLGYITPGCTTALNRKNNEMCNTIFV